MPIISASIKPAVLLYKHPAHFGLLDKFNWTTVKSKLIALSEDAPIGTVYKLFFLGRHGEGWRTFLCPPLL